MLAPKIYVKDKGKIYDVEEIHFDINVVAYNDGVHFDYAEVDFDEVEFIYNTGYKDINGNYIYTGDKLEYQSADEHYLRRCIVEKEEEKVNKEQKIQELSNKIEKSRAEIDALKEELEKLQDKPYEISYPEPKSKVYYINSYTGEIHCILLNVIDKEVKHLYELGLYFDTKEEAEQFIKEQTLIKKIKCWAKEKNDGWEPDWDEGNKYYIFYNYSYCEFETSSTVISNNFKKLPYFKTREIAQACIDEFGEEIKEVFC